MKRIDIDFKYTNTKYLMDFDINYYTQNLLYEHFVRREICDPPMVETILDCLSQGATFIDVGCHVGYYTLIGRQKVGDEGSVYAFDPNPFTYSVLMNNIMLNGYKNIYAYNCALSNKEGTSTLNIPVCDEGLSTLCSLKNLETEIQQSKYKSSEVVHTVTKRLDNVFENLMENKIALIKLDVEGFEQEVIEGAMNFILNKKPLNIIFEVNKMVPNQKSNQMRNILNLLRPIGYESFIIHPWPYSEVDNDYGRLTQFTEVENIQYANILMKYEKEK